MLTSPQTLPAVSSMRLPAPSGHHLLLTSWNKAAYKAFTENEFAPHNNLPLSFVGARKREILTKNYAIARPWLFSHLHRYCPGQAKCQAKCIRAAVQSCGLSDRRTPDL